MIAAFWFSKGLTRWRDYPLQLFNHEVMAPLPSEDAIVMEFLMGVHEVVRIRSLMSSISGDTKKLVILQL